MEDAAMMWVGSAIATRRAALKPQLNERQTGQSVNLQSVSATIETGCPTDRISNELRTLTSWNHPAELSTLLSCSGHVSQQ